MPNISEPLKKEVWEQVGAITFVSDFDDWRSAIEQGCESFCSHMLEGGYQISDETAVVAATLLAEVLAEIHDYIENNA